MDELETRFVGRVYRIYSPDTDLVYIGSTRTTLEQRFWAHKYKFRRWQLGKTDYTSSFEIMKHGNAQIELVLEDEFGDTLQLLEIEKYWIGKSNAVNRNRPLKTQDEHLQYAREWQGKKMPCPTCSKVMRRDQLRKHTIRKHSTSI